MQQKLKQILEELRFLSFKSCRMIIGYSRRYWAIALVYIHKFIVMAKARWPTIRERLQQYAILIRLDRPVGIFLLLWPTLWGLWIAAKGVPDIHVLIVFVLGVVLMRSAGCVLNDIADRRYDPHVKRTKNRPLANGNVSSIEALIVAISLIFIAFLLVLTMNWLTVQLAFVAVILAGIYPFMKRYTYLPQFFLGLTFGWAIPMGFAAQTGSVPQIAWLLLIANILWSVVYDTMYAMVDREDDLKIGVKSTAILFDDADRVIIGIIQILVLITLVMTGKQAQLGIAYFSGLAVASCFFIYQLKLIWGRKPEQCMKAFLNNNWFGLTIFIGLFLDFIINNNV
jgi:4-hydroxybenzoate polyprenyltransferase